MCVYMCSLDIPVAISAMAVPGQKCTKACCFCLFYTGVGYFNVMLEVCLRPKSGKRINLD